MTTDGDGSDRRETVMQRAIAHRDEVLGYLFGITRDLDKAEDLLQETFVVLCRRWREYDQDLPFLPWAIGVAKRTFLGSLKDRSRRLVLMESNVLEQAFKEWQPDTRTQELLGILRRCAARLSERQRRCFDMRYRLELPHKVICTRLGMRADAVYQLLTRTRRALRTCVTQFRAGEEGGA